MKSLYITLITISLFSGYHSAGDHIILLDKDNRSAFKTAVAHIESLLDSDNRSIVGPSGEILDTYPFISAIEADLNQEAIDMLLNDDNVKAVVPNDPNYLLATQKDSTWGLARISSKENNITPPYNFNYDDMYSGQNVTVYVIDTGIRLDHNEFGGRAKFGTVVIDGENEEDEHGHGTHCAGIVAGETYGVAKNANVIAVKVFNKYGSGKTSYTIKGINWAIEDAEKNNRKSIFSMSLGGKANEAMNCAIDEATRRGVLVIAAAGNENQNACNCSPASSENAITVGSVDVQNKKSRFSNWGRCVNILAPGSYILSAGIKNITDATIKSVTSMACPHVAGVAAEIWSQFPGLSASELRDKVIGMALKDKTTGWDNDDATANLLLNNGC
ncbi:subtilisin-like protein [Conidiobolus coronatus NRRL 28638]|uniref:Subtilisin-like protein n=1 Tax=Conidiobolus coronatus (strain ATCC 28846 / CBS 209.66 / NRRL 28638) TaxID=796925 RepID=A0A137NYZ5_CONC2|nr:subtilisin-like protein [Conidiobolus coronatus NRRL 28638]|eukprot:KXN67952.1 subtilisin-like protein [Conidiobolus coronatus NRRL 28638]